MAKALLIIDMVKKDVDTLWNKKTIVKNQVKLMNAFVNSEQKVILVGGKGKWKKNPVMLRLWGDESKDKKGKLLPRADRSIVPELLNAPHDLHIGKPEYSAFYNTNLENYLKKKNIHEVYLSGIFAGCCVYFTGADAAMRGLQPFIVSDAVASSTKKNTDANIKNFTTFMGPAITTTSLIEKLQA